MLSGFFPVLPCPECFQIIDKKSWNNKVAALFNEDKSEILCSLPVGCGVSHLDSSVERPGYGKGMIRPTTGVDLGYSGARQYNFLIFFCSQVLVIIFYLFIYFALRGAESSWPTQGADSSWGSCRFWPPDQILETAHEPASVNAQIDCLQSTYSSDFFLQETQLHKFVTGRGEAWMHDTSEPSFPTNIKSKLKVQKLSCGAICKVRVWALSPKSWIRIQSN